MGTFATPPPRPSLAGDNTAYMPPFRHLEGCEVSLACVFMSTPTHPFRRPLIHWTIGTPTSRATLVILSHQEYIEQTIDSPLLHVHHTYRCVPLCVARCCLVRVRAGIEGSLAVVGVQSRLLNVQQSATWDICHTDPLYIGLAFDNARLMTSWYYLFLMKRSLAGKRTPAISLGPGHCWDARYLVNG